MASMPLIAPQGLTKLQAHSRNMSAGLHNNVDQVAQLASAFDWAISDACHFANTCALYGAFTLNNKAVFGLECVLLEV